jgi:XTP/dITP diphosphohydrolase
MTRLILATRNAGKITELHAILADAGLDLELVGADAYPEIPDVKETGVTFTENALLKDKTKNTTLQLKNNKLLKYQ